MSSEEKDLALGKAVRQLRESQSALNLLTLEIHSFAESYESIANALRRFVSIGTGVAAEIRVPGRHAIDPKDHLSEALKGLPDPILVQLRCSEVSRLLEQVATLERATKS